MSKRLQVLFDEQELQEIQKIARRNHMTVAEWVRQTLRSACKQQPLSDAQRKLQVVRAAAQNRFPTGDVGQMLKEIEQGYYSAQGYHSTGL